MCGASRVLRRADECSEEGLEVVRENGVGWSSQLSVLASSPSTRYSYLLTVSCDLQHSYRLGRALSSLPDLTGNDRRRLPGPGRSRQCPMPVRSSPPAEGLTPLSAPPLLAAGTPVHRSALLLAALHAGRRATSCCSAGAESMFRRAPCRSHRVAS